MPKTATPTSDEEFPLNVAVTKIVTPALPRHYYLISWPNAASDPTDFRVQYRFAENLNDEVFLEFPYPSAPFSVDVVDATELREFSISDLLSSSSEHAWFYDSLNLRLVLKLRAKTLQGQNVLPEGTEIIVEIRPQ